MGYPPLELDGVTPRRPSSIASTSYAAGGKPLAFKKEDLLVLRTFTCKVVAWLSEDGIQKLFPLNCDFQYTFNTKAQIKNTVSVNINLFLILTVIVNSEFSLQLR